MKVSVITPTADRNHFLDGLYALLKKQTYSDWEWLIYDTSYKPFPILDPQVRYHHDSALVSIGEKRNRLIKEARGEVIIHCDDDDYYAPHYLAYIVSQLKTYDFFTLHSWFSYDMKTRQTYYWATEEIVRTQFYISPLLGGNIREIDFGADSETFKEKLNQKGRLGYGFTYAYKKSLSICYPFEDRDFGEDRRFYEAIKDKGYAIGMAEDTEGKAIHVIHETNTSAEYPQYRIPHFLIKQYLPDFFSHMCRYEN